MKKTVIWTLLACVGILLGGCFHKPTPNTHQAAYFNVQLGLGYLKQGNRKRAKQKLLLALQQAPRWPTALDAMAYYLELTGDVKRAGYFYRKAIAVKPGAGAALNNYGAFLCRLKRYQQALHYFDLSTKDLKYINSAKALENAGICALAFKQKILAKQYFLKALAQDPKSMISNIELRKLGYGKRQRLDNNDRNRIRKST